MARKITNKGSVGAADEFATDDIDYINKLLTGVDQSATDPVDMATTFTFRHGKAKIRNSGDTASTTVNTAATTNNTITLPNETGTALTSATADVVKNDQNNDLGDFYLDFGDIAAPSNPASGKVRVFYNTATGELSVRKSGGTTVSLESGGGGGSWDPTAAETLTNKTIVFANNTLTNVASLNTAQTFTTAAKTFNSGLLKIRNPLDTFSFTVVSGAITADRNLTIPALSSDLTMAALEGAQSFTGIKTFSTAPVISSISNSGTVTIPTGTDTLVNLAGTQTLTGKTISGGSNTLSNIAKSAIPSATVYNDQNNLLGAFYQEISEIAAPGNPAATARRIYMDSTTHKLSVRTNAGTSVSLEEQPNWSASTTETLTNKTIDYSTNTLTGVASTTTAQTLTNKTISGSSNTLSNIPKSALPSSGVFNDQNNALGAFYEELEEIAAPANPASGSRRVYVDSTTHKLSVRTSAGTSVSLEEQPTWSPSATETLTNKTIDYSTNTLTGVASTTTAQTLTNKTLTTPVISSISNGGTVTIPSGADTLVTLAAAQTLINKILTTPQIATIKPDASHAINLPAVDDTFVTLAASQTLTNKTLTSPIISSISNSGTVTIPTGTDTLVNLGGSQTLTSKTLTTPTIASILSGSGTFTINTSGTVTVPNVTGTLSTIDTAQTISAVKTYSAAPVISTITNSGNTLTLPTTTDTIVGRATTDTLTTKTIKAISQTNLEGFNLMPDVRAWGFWLPNTTTGTAASGILAGSVGVGGTVANATLDTNGKYTNFTGSTANTAIGLRNSQGSMLMRLKNFRFKAKFRINTAANATDTFRLFVGLTSATAFMTGDTVLNSRHGIGLFLRAADTDTSGDFFQITRNDGTATAPTPTATSAALDTAIHTFEIKSVEAGTPTVSWSLDGGAFTDYTTSLPGSTTGIMPQTYIEPTTATSKSLDIWYELVEMDP